MRRYRSRSRSIEMSKVTTNLLPLPRPLSKMGERAGVRGRSSLGPVSELALIDSPASPVPSPRPSPRRGEGAKLVLASTLALLLAGCINVGPDYHHPVEKPVALQGMDTARQSNADFQADWWKQFDDPTLDTLIARAAKNAPDLKIALARLKEARALLGTARSGQWPDIETDAGYTRSRGQTPGVSEQRTTTTAYQAGFDASWELDLFGGVRRQVEAARAGSEAAAASLQDAQVTLFAEVARNYFDLRGAQLRIEVAQRDIANQREALELIESRAALGTGSEQDVASARARLAGVEATLPVLATRAQADSF